MRKISKILLCLCILLPSALRAQTDEELTRIAINGTRIASSGETILVAKSEKTSVRVKIGTHEVQTSKRSDGWADTDRPGCGYGGPCGFVDYIKIDLNNKPIFVGRSVYCDLASLNRGEIKIGEDESTLILIGGDGAESYVIKIVFDSEHVKRRILSGFGEPDKPMQETTYHIVVVGD